MSAFVSAALIDEDRAGYRRWWFSATLAAGVHGAVAMAALAWHMTSKPLDRHVLPAVGAFLVDLTLPPATQSPQLSLPQSEAIRDRGAIPLGRTAEQGSTANRDNSADSAGLQRSEAAPGANGLRADAPTAAEPPDDAAKEGGAGAAASHAFAPTIRVDPGPLDTSITALPSLYRRNTFGQNRMILLRPLRHPGQAQLPVNSPSALMNAPGGLGVHRSPAHGPGAYVQDRVNAAIEKENRSRLERARNGSTVPGTNSLGIKNTAGSSPHDNSKNAVGAATANNGVGSAQSGVINGTTRNAVGMTIQLHPSPHGINIEEHREGVAGLKAREGVTGLKTAVPPGNTGLMAATSPPGILNGRGMARPGTSLTVLGGAPKTVPGSLSGSDFRPKYQ